MSGSNEDLLPAAPKSRGLRTYMYILIMVWTALVMGMLVVAVHQTQTDTREYGVVYYEALSLGSILVFGVLGIVLGIRRLHGRESERDQAVAALQKANDELEWRVSDRTAEFSRLNESLRLEIIEREKFEEALRKSEERYRRLVENAPLGIMCLNNDGGITEANPAFLSIMDIPSIETARSTNVLTSPGFTDSSLAGALGRCLLTHEQSSSEKRFVTSLGKEVALRLHLAPLRDNDDRLIGVQAIVDDMTERLRAREELKQSEQRFRSLFEAATEFIHILEPNGVVLQTNPAVTTGLGYSREELVGRCLAEFCAPSSRADFLEQIPRILEKGYDRQEMDLVRKDGTTITVDSYCSPIRDAQGEIATLVLFQRDITDRKLAEQKIQQQNEFLKEVLESLTHPFYVIDTQSYEVLLANSAAGLAPDSRRSTCYELAHGTSEPCNTPDRVCPLEEARNTRKSLTVEHIHYDREGNPRNIEVHAYPVLDTLGNVAQVIEYSFDVTERRRTEEALRQSEERMRRVIEASPVGIGIAQHGRYQYVNPAFVQTFGYDDANEIVGLPLGAICVSEDRYLLRRTSKDILDGRPVSKFYEITGVLKNLQHFEAALWLAGIEHQGEPAVLVFVTDTSEERRLRAQLMHAQKMDAIGTLAGGIAHDFNNLLQAIHGYAELALFKTRKDEPGHSEFQVILQASRRAGELTQGLLTFSRQVLGKRRPVDLNREIDDVAKILSRTIPKMIRTELKLANDVKIVNGDPAQLQQVVVNLAVNARDAMPEGGKLLIETRNVVLDAQHCKIYPGTEPGRHLLLEVSDNGRGMEPETLERIFEPFFSTKERGRGTGLGLSIVYGIVKSHGGNIMCYSVPGIGTSFKIYLPVIDCEAAVEEGPAAGEIPSGNETILLIDDEEPLRQLGSETLSRFGYTVMTADGARQGLETYDRERQTISLVILDLIMPELSGVECLRGILSIDPDAKVILVSGYPAAGDLERSVQERARGFIRKPYETRKLLEMVREVLDEG